MGSPVLLATLGACLVLLSSTSQAAEVCYLTTTAAIVSPQALAAPCGRSPDREQLHSHPRGRLPKDLPQLQLLLYGMSLHPHTPCRSTPTRPLLRLPLPPSRPTPRWVSPCQAVHRVTPASGSSQHAVTAALLRRGSCSHTRAQCPTRLPCAACRSGPLMVRSSGRSVPSRALRPAISGPRSE